MMKTDRIVVVISGAWLILLYYAVTIREIDHEEFLILGVLPVFLAWGIRWIRGRWSIRSLKARPREESEVSEPMLSEATPSVDIPSVSMSSVAMPSVGLHYRFVIAASFVSAAIVALLLGRLDGSVESIASVVGMTASAAAIPLILMRFVSVRAGWIGFSVMTFGVFYGISN